MSTQEKDELIGAAYRRLDGALAPPPDGPDRITDRITVRRRRRAVGRTGLAAVVVVGIVGGVTLARSGDTGAGPDVAVDPAGPPVSTLVLTRPDGSTYAFDDVTVSCDAPEGEEVAADGPQRIWATSPMKIKDERAVDPFVYFQGIVSKIEGDRTFTFPNDWTMDSEHYPMVLFMADSEGNAERGNEVASSEGTATGTVRVLEASCSPVPTLRLEVGMTLGSEVNQSPLDIAGALR